MTTATIKSGKISLEVVTKMAKAMARAGVSEVRPCKLRKGNPYRNEAISQVLIDEEGNVFVEVKNSNQIILPQLVAVQ